LITHTNIEEINRNEVYFCDINILYALSEEDYTKALEIYDFHCRISLKLDI